LSWDDAIKLVSLFIPIIATIVGLVVWLVKDMRKASAVREKAKLEKEKEETKEKEYLRKEAIRREDYIINQAEKRETLLMEHIKLLDESQNEIASSLRELATSLQETNKKVDVIQNDVQELKKREVC